MRKAKEELFEQRARVMKALAHPSRLMMVDELSRGERCVCELTEMVGADISTVSKHLSVLKDAGIVDYRTEGVQHLYRLKAPCVLNVFRCIESVRGDQARHGAAEPAPATQNG